MLIILFFLALLTEGDENNFSILYYGWFDIGLGRILFWPDTGYLADF